MDFSAGPVAKKQPAHAETWIDSYSGKTPRASGQLSPCAYTLLYLRSRAHELLQQLKPATPLRPMLLHKENPPQRRPFSKDLRATPACHN